MRSDKAKVRSDGEVKGEVSFKVYESLEEAGVDLGGNTALALLNVQVKTKAMNDFRSQFNAKPTKEAVKNKAMARISGDEWLASAGDPVKIADLVNKYVAVIENEMENEEQAAAAAEESKAPATDAAANG